MPRQIHELTETETKAVIGGARLPVSPYQSHLPVERRPDMPVRP